MPYMLDTDTVSYVIRRTPASVIETMEAKGAEGSALVISSITYAELRLGAERSAAAAKHHRLIDLFCERLSAILAWDASAADEYARVQAALWTAGTPIGGNDTMIAAHALSAECILVSNNQRHFQRVPNLALENWVDSGP